MNLKGFSEEERQALLDLTILAMYADSHLAVVEDARVQRLLSALGSDSDYDRNKQYDAAVTRLRRHSQTIEEASVYAAKLAGVFATREHRLQAHDVISDLVTSDDQIAPQESNYLAVIRQAFQL